MIHELQFKQKPNYDLYRSMLESIKQQHTRPYKLDLTIIKSLSELREEGEVNMPHIIEPIMNHSLIKRANNSKISPNCP